MIWTTFYKHDIGLIYACQIYTQGSKLNDSRDQKDMLVSMVLQWQYNGTAGIYLENVNEVLEHL